MDWIVELVFWFVYLIVSPVLWLFRVDEQWDLSAERARERKHLLLSILLVLAIGFLCLVALVALGRLGYWLRGQ
jgi:hypothetical protein